jgi:hypothetical protein
MYSSDAHVAMSFVAIDFAHERQGSFGHFIQEQRCKGSEVAHERQRQKAAMCASLQPFSNQTCSIRIRVLVLSNRKSDSIPNPVIDTDPHENGHAGEGCFFPRTHVKSQIATPVNENVAQCTERSRWDHKLHLDGQCRGILPGKHRTYLRQRQHQRHGSVMCWCWR